jgi:hypothetical protein
MAEQPVTYKKGYIYLGITVALLSILAVNELRVSLSPETAPAWLSGIFIWLQAHGIPCGTAAIGYEEDIPFWIYRIRVWIAAFGCLAVYSFLFKENLFYRLFEHALLGCATGYSCAVVTQQVLYTKMAKPIMGGITTWQSTGDTSWPVMSNVLLIIPGIIGLLWYFQYSKQMFWVSRIPLCISLGVGAGMGFKNNLNQLIPQITGTFKTFLPDTFIMPGASIFTRLGVGFENFIFVAGTVSTLTYFFFAFGRKTLAMKSSANLGRWYLMLALGVFFGNTFMTRLSALIERVHFLMAEWLHFSAM